MSMIKNISRIDKRILFGYFYFIVLMVFIQIALFFVDDHLAFDIIVQDSLNKIEAILLCIMAVVLIYLVIRIYRRNRNRISNVSQTLIGFLIFNILTLIFEVLGNLIEFVDAVEMYFLMLSIYFTLSIGHYYLALFILEVFYKGIMAPENQKKIVLILIPIIIFNITLCKDLLVITSTQGLAFEVIIGGIIFIIELIYLYLVLSIKSFVLIRRAEEKSVRNAFILLAISSIIIFISLSIAILEGFDIISLGNLIITYGFLLLGLVINYYGFTLPMERSDKQNSR